VNAGRAAGDEAGMNRIALVAVAVAVVAAVGCGPASLYGERAYQPLVVQSAATHKAVLDAAYRAARDAGASSVDLAEEELRLSAVFDEHGITRERLRVQVTEWGQVAVDVRTEMIGRDGEWQVPERMCNDYAHAREREIADRILAAVRM
jgi:hypothetical protein